MPGVSACYFDLSRRELKQFPPTTIADRRHQTIRREMNRKFRVFQHARHREIVGKSAAPVVRYFQSLKDGTANRRRTAPAKVLLRIGAECGRDRRVPNTAQARRHATTFRNEPAITRGSTDVLICKRRN